MISRPSPRSTPRPKTPKPRADKARDRAAPEKDVTTGPPIEVTSVGTAMPPVELLRAPMRRAKRVDGNDAVEGEWREVVSSNIKRVRWTRALDVEFQGGRRYTYVGVPVEVWRALLDAPSHGAFLNIAVTKRYRTL
jgi:hypothetical protein